MSGVRILDLGLGFLPKGAGLPDLFQDSEQLGPVRESLGEVVRIQAPAKILAGKESDQVKQ